MNVYELVDFLVKISGPLALIIISVPRATELVLGRFLSGSLEKTKQQLQIEVERIKYDLGKELEVTKAQLQQNQLQNKNDYDKAKDANIYICKILEDLLLDTRNTFESLDKLEHSEIINETAYKVTKSYLNKAFLAGLTNEGFPQYFEFLKSIEEECEAPLAMINGKFVQEIQSKLAELIEIIRSKIFNIKGH